MSSIAVETKGLTRVFGRTRAVDGLSLSVERGQILAMVGPNGAGKTTLLRLLLGLIAPTQGNAWVLGRACFPPSEANAGKIACVLDGAEPPGGTRLRQLLDLRSGAVEAWDEERAVELLRQRNLALSSPWRTLSKGQKRWTLAVLALLGGAELLILDEPADGLDPSARQELYGLVRDEVNRHGATVILASHILSDVERVADEVAIIDRGRLLLQAALEDLREQVREVEFADELSAKSIPEDIELLSLKRSGDSMLAWLRHQNAADAEGRLPGELRRHTVGLERLYPALIDHRVETDAVSAR